MKIFDKLRDMFSDDPEVEERVMEKEIKPVKKPDFFKEQPIEEITEIDMFKSDPTFKFPVVLDESEDILPIKPKPVQQLTNTSINMMDLDKNKPRDLYKNAEKKPFKPSPVISPIFGLIEDDKNENGTTNPAIPQGKKPTIDEVMSRSSLVEPVKRVEPEIKIDYASDYTTPGLRSSKVAPMPDEDDEKEEDPVIKYQKIDDLLDNTSEHDFYTLVDSMYKNVDEGDEE